MTGCWACSPQSDGSGDLCADCRAARIARKRRERAEMEHAAALAVEHDREQAADFVRWLGCVLAGCAHTGAYTSSDANTFKKNWRTQ